MTLAFLQPIARNGVYLRVYLKTPSEPGQRVFSHCAAAFFLKYVSIPAKNCLAQRKKSSPPVTSPVFRYTLKNAA